jgi:hypothetical protein
MLELIPGRTGQGQYKTTMMFMRDRRGLITLADKSIHLVDFPHSNLR